MHLLVDGAADSVHTFVFAHGAGAPMDTPFMTEIAVGLAARGIRVVRFEFPYMQKQRRGEKRGAPDRMPALEACFAEVLASLGDAHKLMIGGKSMGGRVATRVADKLGVRGVIALGYPFHPPKKHESLRVEHLTTLRTPCLIVQGTRDPFGTPDEVAGYPLASSIRIEWLEDGDHSFAPRKSSGLTLAAHLARAIELAASFVLSPG